MELLTAILPVMILICVLCLVFKKQISHIWGEYGPLPRSKQPDYKPPMAVPPSRYCRVYVDGKWKDGNVVLDHHGTMHVRINQYQE